MGSRSKHDDWAYIDNAATLDYAITQFRETLYEEVGLPPIPTIEERNSKILEMLKQPYPNINGTRIVELLFALPSNLLDYKIFGHFLAVIHDSLLNSEQKLEKILATHKTLTDDPDTRR